MEETEKMSALKKAYAEIILNASKEAAAKIIVSERRAQGFQQELSVAKDEALRLCLRIKQMMDSKMNEAALNSLSQQKRIDVLEAQLQEAEDIVSNLRAELAEAQLELSKLTKNQNQWRSYDEKDETAYVDEEGGIKPHGHGEKINGCCTSPMVQPEAVPVSEAKDSIFGLRSCQTNSIKINGDAESSFARESERTHRIDSCPIIGSTTSHLNDSRRRSGPLEGEKIIQKENGREVEENVGAAGRELLTGASACCRGGLQFNLFHKKRRSGPRHKRSKVEPFEAVKQPSQSVVSTTSNISSSVTTNHDGSSSNSERVSHQSAAGLNNTKQTSETSVISTETDMTTTLADALILIKQENEPKKDSGVVVGGCEGGRAAEIPAVGSSSLAVVSEAKADERRLNEGILTNKVDRIVKYTFQRKRKRESVSRNKEDERHLKVVDAAGVKGGTEHDGGEGVVGGCRSEPTLASSDSPCDSRRLEQVARQLISLSDEKWWQ